MSTTTAPPWLVPGAQVVIWESGGGMSRTENPRARTTTVTKVGKAWFDVEGLNVKINIQRMQSAGQGSSSSWRYEAASPTSEKGAQMLARTRYMTLRSNVTSAIIQWERQHSNENRLALIAALTELGEVMEP